MVGDWAPEFDGINEARTFLNVDQSASPDEVEQAFRRVVKDADRKTAIEARELALSDSRSVGRAVTSILCENLRPDDVSSVLDAQSLFDAAAPPVDDFNRYYRGVERTADETVARLKDLQESTADVTDESIQTVRVAQYTLQYRDVEAGKRHVLGPSTNEEYGEAWRGSLSPSWKYSVDTRNGVEFYVHGDRQIELRQDDENPAYLVRFLFDGEPHKEITFPRYGEAKRKVKQWIIDPPSV